MYNFLIKNQMSEIQSSKDNKANLWNLIAATGQVFLLKVWFKSLIYGFMWPDGRPKKNNRAPPLYYVKLRASFQSHRWIQTGVTVRKRSIWVKIGDFLSPVTSKFDGWPWKTIGRIFSATSSFVLHFIAIYQFKWSYSPETPNLGHNRRFFVPCDLEIRGMTWIHNRATLLCYFMIYVTFHSHLWNQNEVTVRRHQIWVKIGDFLSCVILKFDGWPRKTIGHLS